MQQQSKVQIIKLTILSNDQDYQRRLENSLGAISNIIITFLQNGVLSGAGSTDADIDVLLLDLENKNHANIKSVLKKLSGSLPYVKIVLVSDRVDDEILAQSIRHNVCGILSKESSSLIYIKALSAILCGEIWLTQDADIAVEIYGREKHLAFQGTFSGHERRSHRTGTRNRRFGRQRFFEQGNRENGQFKSLHRKNPSSPYI